jgi:hypothetical protein
MQICVFAQDPLFSTEHGTSNRHTLTEVLNKYASAGHIEAIGTTPYVETTREASLQNISFAIETALQYSLHLDFHLDYNLNPNQPPMIHDVIRLLDKAAWTQHAEATKTIVLGHCSRLTLLHDTEWQDLATQIHESKLPIHFVGLPTSDLFMMGRPPAPPPPPPPPPSSSSPPPQNQPESATRPRGTLQIPSMITDFNLNACLGINNVGNAFTPWGTGDPLALASLGVGIYQAGTERDARILYECVSTRARDAIGLGESSTELGSKTGIGDALDIQEGGKGDFLVVENEEWISCPGSLGMKVPARQRVGVQDVVWDPPEVRLRTVIR